MDLNEFVSPSLIALPPVLYALGGALKKSKLRDYLIPFILGGAGIVLAFVWLVAENFPKTVSELCQTLLYCFSQGIICAAVAVYAHNLVLQYQKKDLQ